MNIVDAQADLRRAYTDGGPGVVISGVIWLIAAIVEMRSGTEIGFIVLFLGGMFIFPLALLINRVFFRRDKESAENPGGMLVLESTIAMIAGLLAAWLFLDYKPSFVMPLAAIMVGTHYFAFKTAYGDRLFWVLAASVTMIGLAELFGFMPLPASTAMRVAVLEIMFGAGLTIRALRAA